MWSKMHTVGIVDRDGTRAGVDSDSGAMVVEMVDHWHEHEGRGFTVHYGVTSIGAMTSPDDAIQLHWTTPADKVCHMTVDPECFAGATFTFREAPTGGLASATGTFTPVNKYRVGTPPASGITAFSYDATLGTGGTLLEQYPIGSGANPSTGQHGSGRGALEWGLKPSTVYCCSIESTATVAASLRIDWYELPLDGVLE